MKISYVEIRKVLFQSGGQVRYGGRLYLEGERIMAPSLSHGSKNTKEISSVCVKKLGKKLLKMKKPFEGKYISQVTMDLNIVLISLLNKKKEQP